MCDDTSNIYTPEQRDYVAGVKQELLRDHLLHTRRLLDNISGDRDAFERRCNELTEEVIKLKELLKQQEKDNA